MATLITFIYIHNFSLWKPLIKFYKSLFFIQSQQQEHGTGHTEPGLSGEQFGRHGTGRGRAGQVGKKHGHHDKPQARQAAPPEGGQQDAEAWLHRSA